MNLDHLRYFQTAVKLGSFARAAEIEYISAQGISKAVKELEKEFNVKLVYQSGKKIKPTLAGLEFYHLAAEVLEATDNIHCWSEAFNTNRSQERKISIAVPISAFRGQIVRKSVYKCVSQIPSCSVLNCFCGAGLTALKEDIVQAAFVLGDGSDKGFSTSQLYSIQPKLAVASMHPLTTCDQVNAEEIIQYPIARPYDINHAYRYISLYLGRAGSPAYVDLPPSKSAHDNFLKYDLGAIFVSHCVDLESDYPEIKFLSLNSPDLMMPVHFVWNTQANEQVMNKILRRIKKACRLP